MAPYQGTRSALRRSQGANLEPIVDSDDEAPVELVVISDDEAPVEPIFISDDEALEGCPYFEMLGYHLMECLYEHEKESDPEEEDPSGQYEPMEESDPEISQLLDENPFEQYDFSEEWEAESEEVEQPIFPEGPTPPRCPICGMPGHSQHECHLFACLRCEGPRSRTNPVCPICDPMLRFYFDGVCTGCKSKWATEGLFCAGCDLNQVDYTPSTPPTEFSTTPIEQPGMHAAFDLNQLPPPDEEDMVIIVSSDEEADSDGMDD